MNVVLQIPKWRKDYERFTDIVTVKTNDSYSFYHGMGGKGDLKIFGVTPFPS